MEHPKNGRFMSWVRRGDIHILEALNGPIHGVVALVSRVFDWEEAGGFCAEVLIDIDG